MGTGSRAGGRWSPAAGVSDQAAGAGRIGKIMNERLRQPGREVRQMNGGGRAQAVEALGVSHQVRE